MPETQTTEARPRVTGPSRMQIKPAQITVFCIAYHMPHTPHTLQKHFLLLLFHPSIPLGLSSSTQLFLSSEMGKKLKDRGRKLADKKAGLGRRDRDWMNIH